MLYVSTVTSHAPSWSSKSVHRSSSQTIVSIDRRGCDISCSPVNDPATFFFRARFYAKYIPGSCHVSRTVYAASFRNGKSELWKLFNEIYMCNYYILWRFICVNYDLQSMIRYSLTKHSWSYRYCSNSFVYKVKRKGSCCNWTISQCLYDYFSSTEIQQFDLETHNCGLLLLYINKCYCIYALTIKKFISSWKILK